MKININKDFVTEYRDEFVKGFTLKETATFGITVGICIGGMVIAYKFFGIDPQLGAYLSIPFAFPFLILGFYKYQGYLYLPELIKEIQFSKKLQKLSIADVEPNRKEKIFSVTKRAEIRHGKEE